MTAILGRGDHLPQDDKCGQCNRNVLKKHISMNCDKCQRWFHVGFLNEDTSRMSFAPSQSAARSTKCDTEKIDSSELYKAMKQCNPSKTLMWFCSKCRDDVKSFVNGTSAPDVADTVLNEVKELVKSQTSTMLDEMEKMRADVDDLKGFVTIGKKGKPVKPTKCSSGSESLPTTQTNPAVELSRMKEAHAAALKRFNVVLHNVPVCQSNVAQERIDFDKELIQRMLAKIDCEKRVTYFRRLRRFVDHKPVGFLQKVIVTFAHEEDKWAVISALPANKNVEIDYDGMLGLPNDALNFVRVTKDRTLKELDESRKRYNTWKAREAQSQVAEVAFAPQQNGDGADVASTPTQD